MVVLGKTHSCALSCCCRIFYVQKKKKKLSTHYTGKATPAWFSDFRFPEVLRMVAA